MMPFLTARLSKPRRILIRAAGLATFAALFAFSPMTSAQSFDKVIPIGEWAQYINVQFDGKPILVHLRTGYERPIIFPEPVTLLSINGIPVAQGVVPSLPSCQIELDNDVMGFAPLKRFKQQRVEVRGLDTNRTYSLLVSSSPHGKRQPIQILK